MGKWVGIAMGLVILYYAWLVSRSHDAMLFASGLFVGLLGVVVGGILVAFAVRFTLQGMSRCNATPRSVSPSRKQLSAPTTWAQLPRPADTEPTFQDMNVVQSLGEYR